MKDNMYIGIVEANINGIEVEIRTRKNFTKTYAMRACEHIVEKLRGKNVHSFWVEDKNGKTVNCS